MTYISLFSSAGVGCYGFKMSGFECIATNEYIERRLNVQRYNNKCKYESGYICGDIKLAETKQKLDNEIELWKKKEKIKNVDVIIATPPCQGMSVANHKKSDSEIIRNSLVVESIKIIKKVRPKFFIFENVSSFMKTICTDIDGNDKTISEAIKINLGEEYSYAYRVLNFKNYGSNSSRLRTLVIGVSREFEDDISPYELFPDYESEVTLKNVIGDLPSLKSIGEICENDIYHAFRCYPEYMRNWISGLKEGESAFDNKEDINKPHQIIDGKIVVNKNKNGDKYTRQYWNKVGPCIHTRNDQLASQNTIHPSDDRVFSIRELMRLMTVPDSFKWSDKSTEEINLLSIEEKKAYLKKEEIKIRQSLGEAVPTEIFFRIANKIKKILNAPRLKNIEIEKIILENQLSNTEKLITFINNNKMGLTLSTLSKIAELSNGKRTINNAYYTNKALITEMISNLPEFDKDVLKILEPSAGVGNFIPLIAKRFEGKKLEIDLFDIDSNSIRIAKAILKKYQFSKNINIKFVNADFLKYKFAKKYDLAIGNPPFGKNINNEILLREYKSEAINKNTNNICSFFLDKIQAISKYCAIVFPKFLLNTPEFKESRNYLRKKHFDAIIDFGEKGFPGVLIETIAILLDMQKKPGNVFIKSIPQKIEINQKQNYIFDSKFPYWLIYRNKKFDEVYDKMEFDIFDVVRDRQITKNMLDGKKEDIRVLKSRNISDDGSKIIDISNYDAYIKKDKALKVMVYNYINRDDVYITPNMTYYPRIMHKPRNTIVNGSVAILLPKRNITMTENQRMYYTTDEYRNFYKIARNYQTRSLNIDSCSVFFLGLLKERGDKNV